MKIRGHAHMPRVHLVRLEPLPVFGEVRADRADQYRLEPESRHTECHVGGYATAVDLELVHQKRQRHLVELSFDEQLGEPSGEDHQVIGGDGPGDDLPHRLTVPR